MFSRRSVIIFTAVVFLYLFFLVGHDHLPQKESVHHRPLLVTNPPSPAIIDFWAQWANVFDAARPQIPPIEVHHAASTEEPIRAEDGSRIPTPMTLDLDDEAIESMRKSHQIVLDQPGLNDTEQDAERLFSGTGIVMVAGGRYYAPGRCFCWSSGQ